ncbi:hypothetical protein GCK72_003912 [Caenorhabditis remanei]|uniref:Sdz-33 F-box domain-containing protein n=1 Tax=Caenorhabditis remanei TaxID=31234 RepID=A0A6A5HAU1_CAERE|nr:hypothetical protein GCK72_003912 [Caenorhabditis remanei]KAF1763966.1 hypothetical protein GCK72_003912 [Caenorhabditis remanei]
MTTNHAFKIFHLPNVALKAVLSSMNPVEFDPTFVREYSILIYYAGDDVVHSFNTITTYLSDLFDVQPSFLSLNYKYLQDDIISKIMDNYCNVHNFELKDDVNKDYKIVNYNDQIIVSILKQQDSTLQLKLLFNPPPEFTFDFNSLRNTPVVIEIEHSHWITWNQLLEIKSENVYLCRSNFSNLDLKNLVQIWKNGWTPKWKWLMVQFKEDLDVDTLISERFMNIDLKDCQTSFILKDISTHAYKFRAEFHTFQGVTTKTGYHLTRPDHSIATVTVENNRIGWFYMQSNEPNEKLITRVTKHAFY